MLLDKSTRGRRRKGGGRRGRETILQARTGRKPPGRVRAMLLLLLFAAAPLAALALAVVGVRSLVGAAFAGNPLFTLHTFEIHSDGRLSPALIREYGALPETGNLFRLDLGEIRDRLERVPRVRSATVVRRLPDTLVVRVFERVPIAQVNLPGRSFLMAVDVDGYVLGPGSATPHLPVIEGLRQPGLAPGGVIAEDAVRHALEMIEICDRTPLGQRLQIRRVFVGEADHMELLLAGGERVSMPRRDFQRKLRELASILWTIDDLRMASDRSQIRIDLTTEERFPVRGLSVPPAS